MSNGGQLKPKNETPTLQYKTRYKQLELQSSQTQVPRKQSKITINSSQHNTYPLKSRNPTKIGPEKLNITETQDKDYKLATNMLKDLKEDINESTNEMNEHTNKWWIDMKTTV